MKCKFHKLLKHFVYVNIHDILSGELIVHVDCKELLAIRRMFFLVDMITNTKFSNCPNVFKIGVVWQ